MDWKENAGINRDQRENSGVNVDWKEDAEVDTDRWKKTGGEQGPGS